MIRKSLAELAAAFESKTTNSGGGNLNWKKYFSFWKAPVDSVSTVRFLPDLDQDNALDFLVENFTHELVINGKREKVACAKMYGKACPICEESAKFYDENSPDHNKALGKKYYRKKSYIGQVVVIDSQVEHDQDVTVKLVDFGPQIYNQITAGFKSGDLEEVPYAFKGGHNFRFRKTVTGDGQNSYVTSNFQPKQTDLSEDVIEKVEAEMYNLADYREPETDVSVLAAMLVAEQTGGSLESNAPRQAPKTPLAPAAPAQNEEKAEAPQKTEGASQPATAPKMSVVETLRARAAAKAAAAAENE